MRNKTVGAAFEREFADMLSRNGFWVHVLLRELMKVREAGVRSLSERELKKLCIKRFDKNGIDHQQ